MTKKNPKPQVNRTGNNGSNLGHQETCDAAANNSTSTEPRDKTGFLDLSAELRNTIYDILLAKIPARVEVADAETARPPQEPAFVLTCRTVQWELRPMSYGRMILQLKNATAAKDYLGRMHQGTLGLLREVRLSCRHHFTGDKAERIRQSLEVAKQHYSKTCTLDDGVVKVAVWAYHRKEQRHEVAWFSLKDVSAYQAYKRRKAREEREGQREEGLRKLS